MHLIIFAKVNNDISIEKRQKRENRVNREERGGSSKFFRRILTQPYFILGDMLIFSVISLIQCQNSCKLKNLAKTILLNYVSH